MTRTQTHVHRRNARVLAAGLHPDLRTMVYMDRFVRRGARPPSGLTAAERTRFSAVRNALDMADGFGRVPGNHRLLQTDSYRVASQHPDEPPVAVVERAVRLLHELVPCPDEPVERALVVAQLEPASEMEEALWPLVRSAAALLAGQVVRPTAIVPSTMLLAADEAYGKLLDRILTQTHPLAVAATLHTWVGAPDRRRFELTVRMLDTCFRGYLMQTDAWTATPSIWKGLYIDTTALSGCEVDAYRLMDRLASGPVAEAHEGWRRHVQPLTWVNASLRRLARLGAEVGDLLVLPTEPRPELARLRPASDLFSTENLLWLIQLGLEVLEDPVEIWAWQNLWSRGCRPQACLPQPDELIPFGESQWRVMVPRDFSKTGMIVDYVSTPLAVVSGWSPDACPSFTRSLSARAGHVPTLVAENACRRVRRHWRQLQAAGADLPDIPDRLAYMTRKILALWMAQRVDTAVLTRWLSHASAETNQPYAQPTLPRLLDIRDAQREERP